MEVSRLEKKTQNVWQRGYAGHVGTLTAERDGGTLKCGSLMRVSV
jgi:hypothetical protein